MTWWCCIDGFETGSLSSLCRHRWERTPRSPPVGWAAFEELQVCGVPLWSAVLACSEHWYCSRHFWQSDIAWSCADLSQGARVAAVGPPYAPLLSAEGLRVLDLGSGSGRDCYLAAALVGPAGRVTGVRATPCSAATSQMWLVTKIWS